MNHTTPRMLASLKANALLLDTIPTAVSYCTIPTSFTDGHAENSAMFCVLSDNASSAKRALHIGPCDSGLSESWPKFFGRLCFIRALHKTWVLISLCLTAMGTILDLSLPEIKPRVYSKTSKACWSSCVDSIFVVDDSINGRIFSVQQKDAQDAQWRTSVHLPLIRRLVAVQYIVLRA